MSEPTRANVLLGVGGGIGAVKVPELSSPRSVRVVFRRSGELSRAAAAFLELARGAREMTEGAEFNTKERS